MKTKMMLIISALFIFGCQAYAEKQDTMEKDTTQNMDTLEIATFAGGCFWCTESDFEKIKGVHQVISGYTGGQQMNPTYEQVSMGGTGHTEAVQVHYDPGVVTYRALLDVFWHHVDPTDPGGQFVDRGSQYRSEIFYHTGMQQQEALASKKRLEASMAFDKPIVTAITKFEKFYPAEEYHQDYYKKNPYRYKYYRWGSGRDQFLEKTWQKADMSEKTSMMKDAPAEPWVRPMDAQIKQKLTQLQYRVTQNNGTEPPFDNEYWNNKQAGIYVDIVSGEPLFSSTDKFESKTGWPSFTKPLDAAYIVERTDKTLFMTRTEVRSRIADSHLGHVFDDGPPPTGLRYCINSAALRFIPKEKLAMEGYGKYLGMF